MLLALLCGELAVQVRQALADSQFAPTINLSKTSEGLAKRISSRPDIAADGSNVYVVWQDVIAIGRRNTYSIIFRGSKDSGRRFEHAVHVSLTGVSPRVAAAGSAVYVVWRDSSGIVFRRSLDQGRTWLPILSLSGTTGDNPTIAVAGPEVYVAWEEGPSPTR